MATLLGTLTAFVGTMLVFALAAQSLQEVLKTMLVIKGRTMLRAIEGLILEATKTNHQWTIDADAILRQVVHRLGALGQNGIRSEKIRLDALPAAQLESLISKVEPADVPGLPGDRAAALEVLAAIGKQAKDWYSIAVEPVDDRYRRRMRVLALLSSALVVLPFNLDAIRIFNLAETNAEFRTQVTALAARMDSVYRPTPDSAQVPVDSGRSGAVMTVDSTARQTPRLSSNDVQEMHRMFSEGVLGRFRLVNLKQPRWWLGILLSIVLVSLGAPFWHDLLESLFGFKNWLGTKNMNSGGSTVPTDTNR